MKQPTLKLLKDRCEEVGDMWLWKQMTNESGVPQVRAYCGPHVSAYRLSYCLAHGLKLSDLNGLVVWPTTEQGDINPKNLMAGTRASMIAWRKDRGQMAKSATAIANITAGSRARKTVKTTPENIALIRSSTLPARVLSEQTGLARSTISKIRAHTIWANVLPTASVFSMGAMA
jgi:hypothetical protein